MHSEENIEEVKPKRTVIKMFSEELSKKMAIWPGKYHMVASMNSETDWEMFYQYHCLCQDVVLKAWDYLKVAGKEGLSEDELQVATNALYESLIVALKISTDVPDIKTIDT